VVRLSETPKFLAHPWQSVRSWIRTRRQDLDVALTPTLGRIKPRTFKLIFNFRASVYGGPARITESGGRLYVNDSNFLGNPWAISDQQLAFSWYRDGLGQRAQAFREAYCLDHVVINRQDLIIDCGANAGDLLLHLRSSQDEFRYIGFEPSGKAYEALQHNAADHKVLPLALGNKNGTAMFYKSPQNGDCSTIAQGNYTEMVSVEMVRLDSLVDESVRLLKIDAEGAEPEVLQGASKLLPLIDWISVDTGPERGEARATTTEEVRDFLRKHDFEMVAFNPTRISCLFMRRDLDI